MRDILIGRSLVKFVARDAANAQAVAAGLVAFGRRQTGGDSSVGSRSPAAMRANTSAWMSPLQVVKGRADFRCAPTQN